MDSTRPHSPSALDAANSSTSETGSTESTALANPSRPGRLSRWNPKLSWIDYASIPCTAVFFAAAFPPFNLHGLIWVALLPFWWRLQSLNTIYSSVFYGLMCGYASCLAVTWWLETVTVAGALLLPVWTSLPWVVTALAAVRIRPDSLRGLVVLPLVWTLAEWLRASGYTSFAWCQLAHPLWCDRFLLRLTQLGGSWCLSWLVATVSIGLTALIRNLPDCLRSFGSQSRPSVVWRGGLSFLAVCLPMAGYLAAPALETDIESEGWLTLRVGAVQGNFDLDEKHSSEWEVYLDRYRTLSLEAAQQGAELIVWPESSVIHPLRYWYSVVNRVQEIVDEAGAPILVGAIDGRALYADEDDRGELYNTAVLWRPGDMPRQQTAPCDIGDLPQYSKRHLVPFGETVPFGRHWPFSLLEDVVENAGGGIFEPGRSGTLFEGPKGIRFGVGICFESTLERQMAAYRKAGAQFLVVTTNDAWFRRSPGAEQHFLQSVFRAAENGVPVIRAANTGITALIDHEGTVQQRLPWFETNVLIGDIRIPPSNK